MQRKTPGGIWALRTVTAVIAIVVVVVVGTVAYSAYEDFDGVRQELAGGLHPVAVTIVPQGAGESATLTVSVPNRGVYSLSLAAACESPPSGVTCAPAKVDIRPGATGTLNFTVTVANAQAFLQSGSSINGTVTMSLEPFVSLSVGVDFGSYLTSAGGA